MQQDIAPTDNGADSLVKIEANFTELYGKTDKITNASASAPASLDLAEDTDNGTNKITLTAPSAIASDKVITLPDETGTVVLGSGWTPVLDSWSYASADAPTFTITVPSGAASLYSPGMRIRLTQTTVKYFIVTAVSDTVLTVYGGTDYTLVNAAISSVSYSTQKAPFGFPLSPAKWTVEVTDNVLRNQATPVQNTWYNLNSNLINIPIGIWKCSYHAATGADRAVSTTSILTQVTLSTGNNSESDSDLTAYLYILNTTSDSDSIRGSLYREKILSLSSKTSYYLNCRTISASVGNIYVDGANSKTIIRAECAYL